MVRFQHRVEQSELYFCALNQRRDCLVKNDMVKVNKLQLRYCVADWIGNDFVTEAERCVRVCIYCFGLCVCVSACWGAAPCPVFFPLRFSLGGESSSWPVSVTQPTGLWNDPPWCSPGAPATSLSCSLHTVASLTVFYSFFPSPLWFPLLYIHSLFFFLSYVGRTACFLSFSPET